jgi:hypothetical protein
LKVSSGQANMKLAVARLEEAAIAAIETEMSGEGWQERANDSLLASLFILAWFEVSFFLLRLKFVVRTLRDEEIVLSLRVYCGSRQSSSEVVVKLFQRNLITDIICQITTYRC